MIDNKTSFSDAYLITMASALLLDTASNMKFLDNTKVADYVDKLAKDSIEMED